MAHDMISKSLLSGDLEFNSHLPSLFKIKSLISVQSKMGLCIIHTSSPIKALAWGIEKNTFCLDGESSEAEVS